MRPEIFALVTAIAWGVGGFFEKRGLNMGNLTPQVGITIRTAVALIVLGAVSFPHWKSIPEAGPRALLMLVIGGGVLHSTARRQFADAGYADCLHVAAVQCDHGVDLSDGETDLADGVGDGADYRRHRCPDDSTVALATHYVQAYHYCGELLAVRKVVSAARSGIACPGCCC